MTGCTARLVPDGPACGWVVKTSLVARPVMLKSALVAEVRPEEAAVKVSI